VLGNAFYIIAMQAIGDRVSSKVFNCKFTRHLPLLVMS
jgi:hypothetical protein